MISKFKSEKSNKNKYKCNAVLKKKQGKKEMKIGMMPVTFPLNVCLLILRPYTCGLHNSFRKEYS